MASRARILFEQIKSGGATYIRDELSVGRCEEEYLDFKVGDAQGPGRYQNKQTKKEAKRDLSEAISGFANGEGGVLIFGIDCRKEEIDGQQIDHSVGMVEVIKPFEWASEFRSELKDLAIEPVSGIEILAIETSPDKSGVVVCYIPNAKSVPVRACRKTGQPYMMRSGDSFIVIPHHYLRRMFYPKANVIPRLTAKFRSFSNIGSSNCEIQFAISMTNHGTASIRKPFIVGRLSEDLTAKGTLNPQLWIRQDDHNFYTEELETRSIHPGMDVQLPQFNLRMIQPHAMSDFTMTLDVFMENSDGYRFIVKLSVDPANYVRVGPGSVIEPSQLES